MNTADAIKVIRKALLRPGTNAEVNTRIGAAVRRLQEAIALLEGAPR